MIQRYFFSGAAEVTLDRQGRIMMPGARRPHSSATPSQVSTTTWRSGTCRVAVATEDVEGRAEDVAERLAAKRD
jgi:hypothetical protein